MVDADSHFKPLLPSLLNIYKIVEHIEILSTGIQFQSYTVIPTILLCDFGVLGHMSSQNDAIMSWLRLTATSNRIPHPYWTHTKCMSTLIYCFKAYSCSLIQLYPPYSAQVLVLWVTCRDVMMPLCHG